MAAANDGRVAYSTSGAHRHNLQLLPIASEIDWQFDSSNVCHENIPIAICLTARHRPCAFRIAWRRSTVCQRIGAQIRRDPDLIRLAR